MPNRYQRYTSESGYIIPGTTSGTFLNNSEKEMIADALFTGKATSIADLKKVAGDFTEGYGFNQWLKKMIDANKVAGNISFDSSVIKDDGTFDMETIVPAIESMASGSTTEQDEYAALTDEAYKDRLGLVTDPNGAGANRYRQDMYGALAREKSSVDETIGAAELDAYRMLGQQQLELESTIAEQRKAALKSGTTSAQLASMQLQNMFAAQSGASQIATNVMATKMANQQNYAQQRTGVETGLYDYINSQQTIAATAGAQNLAALGSLSSYRNQYYNNYTGSAKARKELGSNLFESIAGK